MPIISGAVVDPAVQPADVRPSLPFVVLRDLSAPPVQMSWIGPDGIEWPLYGDDGIGPGITMLPGVAGHRAPSWAVTSQPLPSGGAYARWSHIEPRVLTLPVNIHADTSGEFTDLCRGFVNSVTATLPRAGVPILGRARAYQPDGTWRESACHYSGGLEGLDDGAHGYRSINAVLSLTGPDARCYGESQVGVQFTYSPILDFYQPYETLSPSQTLGSQIVVVDGDIDADPVWTVNGAYTSATIGIPGASFTLRAPLAVGHWVRVDLAAKSLTDDLGAGRFTDLLLPGSELFALPSGPVELDVLLQGVGPGSSVRLDYRPAYKSLV